ncbi:MAG: substrate-binding domain-containing protein [bacterium]|nr:substrate-binding domain-containing protein [bacterium]
MAIAMGLQWLYKRHVGSFAGTQDYAQEQGWATTVDEFPAESLRARQTGKLPYDGIVARADQSLADRATQLGVPVVNVWLSSPICESLPGVFPDFAASGQLRAEHLLSRGLRRFAVLGNHQDLASKIETASFCDTLAEAGFDCLPSDVPHDYSNSYAKQQKAERQIDAWIDLWKPPVGVFVYDDVLGRLVAQMCQRRGFRVPEDVAIAAGANEEIVCEQPSPSLTSVERGYHRVGYEAAKLLASLMNAPKSRGKTGSVEPPRHIFVPPEGLVIRESTDFYAVNDELVAQALLFISANSHKQIGQDDVSNAVATGTRTLLRRFRKSLDRSISGMICHVRIERAKRELVQSDRSMKEIARAVGFGKAMRMYNTFVREVGVSPTDYRDMRKMRKND